MCLSGKHVLIHRGCCYFSQHHELRPLGRSHFLSLHREFVLYPRTIRFFRFALSMCRMMGSLSESRTSGGGPSQRSQFLVLTKGVWPLRTRMGRAVLRMTVTGVRCFKIVLDSSSQKLYSYPDNHARQGKLLIRSVILLQKIGRSH